MKRIACLLLMTTSLFAIDEGFWYVSGGVAAIVPKVTVGYRNQKEHWGADYSFTAAIVPGFYSCGLQMNSLFFPRAGQGYIGISTGVHRMLSTIQDIGGCYTISLGGVCGYQFRTESHTHFIEGKLGLPIIDLVNDRLINICIPIPSLSYGMSF